MAAHVRKKIVQIGLNKCGTTSLHKFFLRNGIPSVHWDEGKLAKCLYERYSRGEDPLIDYPKITFFSDLECVLRDRKLVEAYKLFKYIYNWYPDAYYILNTRNVGAWLRSRSRHEGGRGHEKLHVTP